MLVESRVKFGGDGKAVAALLSQVIGNIQTAIGYGTLRRAGGIAVQVIVGDPVCQGDVIETAADGRIGIRFIDGTVFNLSGSTRVVLNEFVCDSTGTSHSALFRGDQGSLRFHCRPVGKDRLPQGRHAVWKHSGPRPCRRVRHAVAHGTDLLNL